MDDHQFVALIVGGVLGGFALFLLIPALIVTICITVVVVCICNKRCPLYSQRQSRRQQPQVGVLVTVDCEQESDENRSIKYHAIKTTQERCTALQLSSLSATREARGREEVGRAIQMLEREFSNLQRRTSSELTTNATMTTEILIESLTLLPIALRSEYQSFIVGKLETLERAESIRKIFHHLNPHCTFIDYGLLEHIINEFGSRRLKQDMSKYIERVQVFIDQTTVQELMDHWPGVREIPPHFERLRAVIDEDPSLYTLRQLDDLRKRLCSKTKLYETVLILIGIKKRSSFLLNWIIPSIFLPHLKSVIGELSSFFQVEQIYSLTHGGQRLYSMANEYEMRLLILCDEGSGDEIEIQHILSQPEVNPNVYDETSLWHASYNGKVELVRILLENGADVNLPTDDEFGDTPLVEACDGGHVAIAALLIDKGAMIDYKNKLGQHSLYFACFDGKLSIVRLLIERGADIDLPTDDDYGFTALGIACQEGHTEVVCLLIDNGAAVNYKNMCGATPLDIASQCGHLDIVQLLLDSGASMHEPSKTYWTAIPDRSEESHTEIVEQLIEHGAQLHLDIKNRMEGKIALHLARHADIAVSDKQLEMGQVTVESIQTARGASNNDKARRPITNAADSIKEISTALQLSTIKESSGKKEVGKTIQMLEKEFLNLRRTSSELIENTQITMEILIESLTLLPIALRSEYQSFIVGNLETLERAESIRKIFHCLNPHFTFIDYGLLAHIVDDLGSNELKSDMSKYIEAVKIFIDQTTVQELMDHWPGVREIPPHFEELRAVVDEDPSLYRLQRLDDLQKRFCNTIMVSETTLILIGIKRRSSFLLSWIIPSVCLPHLKSVIGELSTFFQVEKIYSLTHGGQRLYSMADEYETRLLTLCDEGSGDENEILCLLSQPDINPNVYDEYGRTCLWHMSYRGNADLVRILLEHGADVNLPNDDELGDTALIEACDRGHVGTAVLLIDYGARVDYRNKCGQHSLYFASYDGKLSIVRLLIQHGAEIDLPTDDDYGFTALGIACQEGYIDVVRLLVDSRASINYRNKLGATPLYMASQCGHHDIVKLLLDCGSNVDELSLTGWTALLDSSDEGHTEVVQELIKHGAQLDIKNREGRTALCLASWKGHADIARLLIEGGADTNICDQEGMTPLKLAMKHNHADVVKVLQDVPRLVQGSLQHH